MEEKMKTLLLNLLLLITLNAQEGLCKQTYELKDAEWIESETEELFKLSSYSMKSKVTINDMEFNYVKANIDLWLQLSANGLKSFNN
jgi:hypothetical protein